MPSGIPSQIHRPKHLTSVIQPSGDTIGSPKQRGRNARDQVDHLALLPKKRVDGRAAGHRIDIEVYVAGTGNLSVLVYQESSAVRAAQGPQVLHGSVTPQKCVRFSSISIDEEVVIGNSRREWVSGQVLGGPDHLAAAVDCARPAFNATECAQIDNLAVLP